ncbi:MAG TPA: hypothetical protein VKP68_15130 [Ramlibacter sp.]|nr:hypothetical protein [Ramlibacter sp.]
MVPLERNHIRRIVAISLSLGLLAACARAPAPARDTPAAELNYLCDDYTAVAMHPGVDAIAVLRSGQELRLRQYPGPRYTDGAHEFRAHGTTGTWTAPPWPPVVCRLKQ